MNKPQRNSLDLQPLPLPGYSGLDVIPLPIPETLAIGYADPLPGTQLRLAAFALQFAQAN